MRWPWCAGRRHWRACPARRASRPASCRTTNANGSSRRSPAPAASCIWRAFCSRAAQRTTRRVTSTARTRWSLPRRRRGVRHIVLVSSLGADPRSSNGYFRSKGEAERRVIGSGLKATIIRTPLLLGPGTAGGARAAPHRRRQIRPRPGGRVAPVAPAGRRRSVPRHPGILPGVGRRRANLRHGRADHSHAARAAATDRTPPRSRSGGPLDAGVAGRLAGRARRVWSAPAA